MQIINNKESVLLESLYNLLNDIRKVINYEKTNPIYDEDHVTINEKSKEIILSNVANSSIISNGKLNEYSKIISYKLCHNGIDNDVVINIKRGLDFNKSFVLDSKNEYTNKIEQLLKLMIYDNSDIAICQQIVDFYL